MGFVFVWLAASASAEFCYLDSGLDTGAAPAPEPAEASWVLASDRPVAAGATFVVRDGSEGLDPIAIVQQGEVIPATQSAFETTRDGEWYRILEPTAPLAEGRAQIELDGTRFARLEVVGRPPVQTLDFEWGEASATRWHRDKPHTTQCGESYGGGPDWRMISLATNAPSSSPEFLLLYEVPSESAPLPASPAAVVSTDASGAVVFEEREGRPRGPCFVGQWVGETGLGAPSEAICVGGGRGCGCSGSGGGGAGVGAGALLVSALIGLRWRRRPSRSRLLDRRRPRSKPRR